jgi:hypothetical protein
MARWIRQPIDFINLLASDYLMGGFRSGTPRTVQRGRKPHQGRSAHNHLDVKKRRLETAPMMFDPTLKYRLATFNAILLLSSQPSVFCKSPLIRNITIYRPLRAKKNRRYTLSVISS